LIQRKDTGQWGLPGGIVDWGEDEKKKVEERREKEGRKEREK